MDKYNPAKDIRIGKCILKKFREELPGRVEAASVSNSSTIKFKVSILRATLFYRITDLGETAIKLYENNHLISAFIITRFVHETLAVLYLFFEKLSVVVDERKFDDFDYFMTKLLFGWKNADDEFPQAYNILTAVDKLNLKIETFRAHYDWLSEFCHPNYSGVYGAYGRINDQYGSVDFTSITAKCSPKIGLQPLIASLELFKHFHDKISDLLPRVVEICESEI